MFEQEKISQILDILGNKNRRRIIDLLQNKPCFVTEISDKLSINPKAVIEHLALMQKEEVIGSYFDDKRRKYYYLIQDIKLSLNMGAVNPRENISESDNSPLPLADTIMHLRSLINARRSIVEKLDGIERDIDRKMEELLTGGEKVFSNEAQPEILLALIHSPLSPIELADACNRQIPEISSALRVLLEKGYIVGVDGKYALKEILTDKSPQ